MMIAFGVRESSAYSVTQTALEGIPLCIAEGKTRSMLGPDACWYTQFFDKLLYMHL